MISNLANHFRSQGKTARWKNGIHQDENPALSRKLDNLLNMKYKEAKNALVLPAQATPIFESEATCVVDKLWEKFEAATTIKAKVPWIQAIAFILMIKASGRRPGDIARLHVNMAIYLPQKQGLLFVMTVSKTGLSRFVVTRKAKNKRSCAVRAIETYITTLKRFNYNFYQTSLLFPNLTRIPKVGQYLWHCENSAIDVQAVNRLLKTTAKECGYTHDLKLYGLRVASALEAREIDTMDSLQKTMDKGGWKTQEMAKHYSKYFPVTQNKGTATSSQLSMWIENPSANRLLARIDKPERDR
ncbi:hypothetical protein BDR26DRAFT_853182 [Obelidium mucronatum]|nr:hypothetical protein BDR26DRAFT_853182 [Obelidium mucronatum]